MRKSPMALPGGQEAQRGKLMHIPARSFGKMHFLSERGHLLMKLTNHQAVPLAAENTISF